MTKTLKWIFKLKVAKHSFRSKIFQRGIRSYANVTLQVKNIPYIGTGRKWINKEKGNRKMSVLSAESLS
jgi:hypothetical protein